MAFRVPFQSLVNNPRRATAIAYGLAAAVLLAAAVNPILPIGTTKLRRAILIDRSASVERRVGYSFAGALAAGARGLKPGDDFCYIEFAAQARVVAPVQEYTKNRIDELLQREPGRDALARNDTNIGSAVELAAETLGAEGGEVVIVTDGLATRGRRDLYEFDHLQIKTLQPPGAAALNRAIVALDAPRAAPPNSNVTVRVAVAATEAFAIPPEIPVEIRSGGAAPVVAKIRILRGEDSYFGTFHFTTPPRGETELIVKLPIADAFPEDDSARRVIYNSQRLRIGFLGQAPELAATLAKIQNADVNVIDPANVMRAWDFDVFIIADAPAQSIAPLAREIESYLNGGGSLLYTGGTVAFSNEAFNSFAHAVPLVPDASGADAIETMILVDASGSMAGEKWRAAQNSIRKLVSILPREPAARAAFFQTDLSNPFLLLNELEQNLASASPRGTTNVASALERAAEWMNRTPAVHKRRIILISDGLEKGGGAPVSGARAAGEMLLLQKIELLTFAIGSDADLEFLRALTLDGTNGRTVTVSNGSELPRAVGDEVTKDALAAGGAVEVYNPPGVPFSLTSLPFIEYVAKTKLRGGARLLASTGGGRPLMAISPDSKIVAFASGAGGSLATNYNDPRLFEILLDGIAARGAALEATAGAENIYCNIINPGTEGAVQIQQKNAVARLYRTGGSEFSGEFSGARGELREGWAKVYSSTGAEIGTVYIHVPHSSDAPPGLAPQIYQNAGAPAAITKKTIPLELCIVAIALLVAGAAAGLLPQREPARE
ncbi:MAG: vWA domain-containing protein [Planctomycetota bacterium]